MILGKDDVSEELEEAQAEARAQESLLSVSLLQLVKNQGVRWQLITIIITMASYQLCGLNVVRCSLVLLFSDCDSCFKLKLCHLYTAGAKCDYTALSACKTF